MTKATIRKKSGSGDPRQYAAVPARFADDGRLEVLLLTSRDTKRWVIPKGWLIRKLGPSATATREAYEEAGVKGTICPDVPAGTYQYQKTLAAGAVIVTVTVFILRVRRQLDTWPEQAERERRWFCSKDAAEMVDEPELAAVLLRLSDIVASPLL